MDTDVEVVKSYNDLLYNDLFLCFEDEKNVSIGTVGSIPKHRCIGELLEEYDSRHFVINGEMDLTTNLKYVTALLKDKYGLILDGRQQQLNFGIYVYSMDYFIAKSYITGEVDITNNTYAIHHYAGTWLSDSDKKKQYIYKNIINIVGGEKNGIVCKIASFIATYKVDGFYGVKKMLKSYFYKYKLKKRAW